MNTFPPSRSLIYYVKFSIKNGQNPDFYRAMFTLFSPDVKKAGSGWTKAQQDKDTAMWIYEEKEGSKKGERG